MTTPLLVVALGLSSTLLVSGLGKLPRARAATTSRALAQSGLRASPYAVRAAAGVEIALAAGLVATTGAAAVAVAVAVLLMLTGYTVVLGPAGGAGGPAGGGCPGGDGAGATGWPGPPNGALLAGTVLLLAGVFRGGSTRHWAAEHAAGQVVLLAAVILVAVTVALARGVLATPARHEAEVVAIEPLPAAPGDYVRWPVPAAPLLDATGGRLSLRDLVRVGARLVVVVDGRQGTAPDVHRWLTRAAQRASVIRPALVVAHAGPPELSSWERPAESDIFADPPGVVASMLGRGVLPSVTLLGADGWLAGGPASGAVAAEQLLADLEAELAIADPGHPSPHREDRRPTDSRQR